MAITFTEFHRNWCFEQTQYFLQMEFSEWFKDPAKISVTDYQDYLSVIKNPISLKEVADRIEKNEYRYLHEWDNDMIRIWDNAIYYNGENSQPAIIANYLKKMYIERCHPLPVSEQDMSMLDIMKKAENLLNSLTKYPPFLKKLQWEIKSISDFNGNAPKWSNLELEIQPTSDKLQNALLSVYDQIKKLKAIKV